MDTANIEALLRETLALEEVYVRANGSHYEIIAVGAIFEGKRPVQKQQAVYAPLNEHITDGTLHAVTIKAFTPGEWTLQRKLIMPA